MSESNNFPKPPNEGEAINLKDANGMIKQLIDLWKITKRNPNENVIPQEEPTDPLKIEEIKRVNTFCTKDGEYNAFIFTKDLIMRFFNGEENDKEGNPRAANYLMVILGAHADGSPTVLTVGCVKKRKKNKEGKDTIQFFPLGIKMEANEYPPRFIEPKLEESEIELIDIDNVEDIDNAIYFEEVIKD